MARDRKDSRRTTTNRANDNRLPEQREYVGVLELTWRGGYVVTNHKQLPADVFVPDHLLAGAQNGQKVVVRLLSWKRHRRYPEGEITDILGYAGDNDTEMHSILAQFGLPYDYPEEPEAEADAIDDGINEQELLRRKDMREVTTFTIDPADAKDFDDAISFRIIPSEDSNLQTEACQSNSSTIYEVGVHIADVTHYVKPDTLLDKEAYSRATSVYLVDRVVPMLPEHLSNGICSLRPDEDKLCFSVIFLIDDKANIIKYNIKQTVIRSNRRFNYDEAQERIEKGEGDYAGELRTLNALAQQLRQRRFAQGAVAFDREESAFTLDENGKPVAMYFRQQKEANQLIEEFMLLANRTVAEHIGAVTGRQKPKTFVYRVHDVPDPDKLKEFASFIRNFGYRLDISPRQTTAHSLNRLLEEVQGKPEQDMIELLAVRSMAKAVYSTDNIGHYGLAFRYYTHFTSPIRRYPDMMVHRLLRQYMKGAASAGKEEYEERCKHCSEQEQLAAAAERASVKYKQVEFMQDNIGKSFDAIVSGVTDWGVYVSLTENKCEGLVPMRVISEKYGDWFFCDEEHFCIEGAQTGKRLRLGDRLQVTLTNADLSKQQLDFAI